MINCRGSCCLTFACCRPAMEVGRGRAVRVFRRSGLGLRFGCGPRLRKSDWDEEHRKGDDEYPSPMTSRDRRIHRRSPRLTACQSRQNRSMEGTHGLSGPKLAPLGPVLAAAHGTNHTGLAVSNVAGTRPSSVSCSIRISSRVDQRDSTSLDPHPACGHPLPVGEGLQATLLAIMKADL